MASKANHVCSGRTCMFCRVLNNNQQGNRPSIQQQANPQVDATVLERIRELESNSLLVSTKSSLINKTKSEELEKLALFDSLTELYNSRTFIKELKEELKRSQRYKRPVSVLMINIDKMKEIQNEYGNLSSDITLKAVAKALQQAIRDVDTAARYSGDYFAIILPETNVAGAAIVAERIRQSINTQTITHNWNNLNITVSIGIASFPANARVHDELIARSIQALEMAIQQGGNRICSI